MTLGDRWNAVMMPNYGTPPIALDRGDGVRVWDDDGNEYLDFVGGIAVSSLGHAHPAIVAAVTAQVGRLAHTSNLVMHEPGIRPGRAARRATRPARRGCSSPTAAPRRTSARSSSPASTVPAARSWRATTASTAEPWARCRSPATRRSASRSSRCPGPVTFVDYGDIDGLRAAVGDTTAAVFVEPTLGEGGVVPAAGRLPRCGTRDLRRVRRAARDRRGAERHRPHRLTGSPARPKGSVRTCSRWRRVSAAACRSAPASVSVRQVSCSRRATTAARSAATRCRARQRSPCSTRSTRTACSTTSSTSANTSPDCSTPSTVRSSQALAAAGCGVPSR